AAPSLMFFRGAVELTDVGCRDAKISLPGERTVSNPKFIGQEGDARGVQKVSEGGVDEPDACANIRQCEEPWKRGWLRLVIPRDQEACPENREGRASKMFH